MRLQRMCLVAGAVLIGAGCEIPTDPPIVEQRWALPLEVVTLDQSELLPGSVTVQGNAYDVSIDPVSESSDLGTLCPSCGPLAGQVVPTPAFTGQFTSTDALPADVQAAAISGGSINIAITNGFSFDPIANGGSLTITVADDDTGTMIGQVVFDGTTDTMTPSSVSQRTMTLSPGTVTGAIRTTVDVVHTGGQQNTTIDLSETIALDAVTTSMLLSSATIAVDGLSASLSDEPLDVEDLDASIVDRIQSGSVILEVANPFGIAFNGSIDVSTITKPVVIGTDPVSEVTVTFTGQELRDILNDANARFSGSGTISGGPVTITPTDELSIDPTIDLTIEIGG